VPVDDPVAHAHARVLDVLAVAPRPLVLEAGCGTRSHLTYPPAAQVVGVDLLSGQLRRNHDTRLRAQGDVAALPVASASADVVVCWDVLEHLPEPARAIGEIARVLQPRGLAVLALPHVLSLKGLVTRLTPWPVHVWVYRHLLGDATAGTDASHQFPTTLRLALRPAGLRRLACAHGLRVESLALYEGPVSRHLRRRHHLADVLLGAAGLASRVLSAGRYDTTLSDIIAVLVRDGDRS